ncbi:flagellar biosynthetic protein FliR [Neobacillus niacini]|uniref:flagellar biosynthetic protein FliR n=1 Tax=Neobacillus niacini TaxID=86668 RepID=UPI0007ABE11B|nr:flagellar biosynthetic protein FliR [Neobacillus niacini]MEC1522181.1 flagellar biosynthetic protein FliR [Neobacillus niacini]
MSILNLVPIFLLVFVRLTSFFVTAPLWMERQIPAPFKWGSAFFISLLVVGLIQPEQMIEMDSTFILLILKEVLVGLCLGFFTNLLLYAVQLAGSFIDLQSGFAMATMFNPQTGIQENLTGRFFYIIAILFFLSIDGHHLLMRGVLASYQWIPIDSWLPGGVSENLVHLSLLIVKDMFWIALLIAAPVVTTIFLVDIALGILAKTVPQMNLFVVGIPIKMAVHFIVLFVFIPVFLMVMEKLIQTMIHSFEQMLKILGA